MKVKYRFLIFFCITFVFGLFVRSYFIESFRITTALMEPALKVGDVVIVNKWKNAINWKGMGFADYLKIPSPKGRIALYENDGVLSVGRVRAVSGEHVIWKQGDLVNSENKDGGLVVPFGYYLILPELNDSEVVLEEYLVKEKDLVGEVQFVWLSLDWGQPSQGPKVRWSRLFTRVD